MARSPSLKKIPEVKRVSLKSPAKLNLYLKILNKRKDGFHNIETVFEKIDLCDQLIFKRNNTGRIKIFSSHPDCPTGKTNLCYKAAAILKKARRVSFGVDITIKKVIPVSAGLGGGSSNAAATLLALNRLWGLSLTKSQILGYARRIGSDVAFFITQESFAMGQGRGDRIKPLRKIRPLWHILVVPDIKLSTAEAYKRIEILRRKNPVCISSTLKEKLFFTKFLPADTKMLTKTGYNVNILIHALRGHNLSLLSTCLFNDFSEPLFRTHPGLLKIKHRLAEWGVMGCSFSGKGPSIFGLTKSRKGAGELRNKLGKEWQRVFVVNTFKDHSLRIE